MQLPLTQGKHALIDDEDYPRVKDYRWCYHRKEGYAIATVYGINPDRPRGQTTYGLHRLILGAPKGVVVDHINGDKLDNRKSNLRLCDRHGNARNRSQPKTTNLSGFKGVTWHKRIGKWSARIGVDSKNINLGYFDDPKEAARVYNKAAIKEHGEFARLNPV